MPGLIRSSVVFFPLFALFFSGIIFPPRWNRDPLGAEMRVKYRTVMVTEDGKISSLEEWIEWMSMELLERLLYIACCMYVLCTLLRQGTEHSVYSVFCLYDMSTTWLDDSTMSGLGMTESITTGRVDVKIGRVRCFRVVVLQEEVSSTDISCFGNGSLASGLRSAVLGPYDRASPSLSTRLKGAERCDPSQPRRDDVGNSVTFWIFMACFSFPPSGFSPLCHLVADMSVGPAEAVLSVGVLSTVYLQDLSMYNRCLT